MLETLGDSSFDKELEPQELDEINSKLKESMQSDVRQAAVWNTLGLILLKTGRLQVQVFNFVVGNSCSFFFHFLIWTFLLLFRVLFQFCLLC